MTKLSLGFSKKDIKNSGIKLRANYDNIFSLIYIGELHLKHDLIKDFEVKKLTVVSYGAYKEFFPCLFTEFLISTFNEESQFKNYHYLPCETKEIVDKQLKTLTTNPKEENATYLAEIFDELLNDFFLGKSQHKQK